MALIFFDIETTGLNIFEDKPIAYQVGINKKASVLKNKPSHLAYLKQILEDKNNTVVGHNLKFDLKFLKYHHQIEPSNIFDTWIAEHLIFGGSKARTKDTTTLKAVAQERINVTLNKDENLRTSFLNTQLTKEQIRYASLDVAILPSIFEAQMKQIKELGLERVIKIEMDCLKANIWLELSGIAINPEITKKTEQDIIISLFKLDNEIRQEFKNCGFKLMDLEGNPAIDINSPNKLLGALQSIGYVKLENTEDDTLLTLKNPLRDLLRSYRHIQKNYGYIKGLRIATRHDNRIYASFNQCGTNTGRFSCNSPNLQQIPPEIRHIFRATDGNKLIIADYSQIELRIMAKVSQEPLFIKALQNNEDLHKLTASLILNKSIESITKEERQQAKAVNFGFLYGLSSSGFKKKMLSDYDKEISYKEADKFRNGFFNNYSTLSKYLNDIGKEAYAKKELRNLSGRLLKLDTFGSTKERDEWSYANQGQNAPIQSLSGDIIKLAMGRLYARFGKEIKLVNAIHDELVLEVEENKTLEYSKIVQDEMQKAGQEFLQEIPCLVEVSIKEAWIK